MTKYAVMEQMKSVGLVPVLRADNEQLALELVSAMYMGGITVFEVTMTIPGAIRVMARLAKERPDVLVGAGTVLDPETARICMLEGARFIVSPSLNIKTVEICQRYDIAVLPGALTPTEIVTAWQAGADVIKVFPANAMGGASYLKSIKAPLPQVEMIPTGGVSLESARSFLDAGAFALGVGADLVDASAIAHGRAHEITSKAARYLEIVQQFRGEN
jgi:2-dehydro-3-deoxyphosphogluconate aldolase / (4S)-4-hydroxy-2-oxoglutarate aldolase